MNIKLVLIFLLGFIVGAFIMQVLTVMAFAITLNSVDTLEINFEFNETAMIDYAYEIANKTMLGVEEK